MGFGQQARRSGFVSAVWNTWRYANETRRLDKYPRKDRTSSERKGYEGYKHTQKDPFTLRGENIEDVGIFTYLAVWVIKIVELHRMFCVNSKSKWCFRTVWKNSRISTGTKLRIIRSNVKSVSLYGSETWKEMKTVTSRLQTFVNRWLRRILNICWTEVI